MSGAEAGDDTDPSSCDGALDSITLTSTPLHIARRVSKPIAVPTAPAGDYLPAAALTPAVLEAKAALKKRLLVDGEIDDYIVAAGRRFRMRMQEGDFEFFWNTAASLPQNAVLVELGVFIGASTVVWASALKAVGNVGAKLYSVDCFDSCSIRGSFSKYKHNLEAFGVTEMVTPLRGLTTKPETVAMFANRSVDVVYVDASHAEWEVIKDITTWFPKVKEGGLMCGHDADPESMGVVKSALKYRKAAYPNVTFVCCERDSMIWHYEWRQGPSFTWGDYAAPPPS